MLPGSFFEAGNDIHPLVWQSDANSDLSMDWVSLKNYDRAYVYLIKGGSEDVDDLGVELKQATDTAGTGSKALAVSRCWYKTGTMTAQGTWTEVNVGSGTADDFISFGASVPSGATRVVADVNTNALHLLIEVKSDDLDVNGGFNSISATIEGDNVDNAVLVSALAILTDSYFPRAIPASPL
jgi:hypothetical protein